MASTGKKRFKTSTKPHDDRKPRAMRLKPGASGEASDDWISALAKQATSTQPDGSGAVVLSKAERIQRRNEKKRKREERNPHAFETLRGEKDSGVHVDASKQRERVFRMSQAYLQRLGRMLQVCAKAVEENSSAHPKPYQSLDTVIKGKATAGAQLNDQLAQPRKRDYGGLGLARPSLFIPLRDPSFVPKLEEEFAQHVPGFFGKHRTKSMKRQLDGNMLWRQLAEKRTVTGKIGGKRLSDMTPDERVEAMIKAGMI